MATDKTVNIFTVLKARHVGKGDYILTDDGWSEVKERESEYRTIYVDFHLATGIITVSLDENIIVRKTCLLK